MKQKIDPPIDNDSSCKSLINRNGDNVFGKVKLDILK